MNRFIVVAFLFLCSFANAQSPASSDVVLAGDSYLASFSTSTEAPVPGLNDRFACVPQAVIWLSMRNSQCLRWNQACLGAGDPTRLEDAQAAWQVGIDALDQAEADAQALVDSTYLTYQIALNVGTQAQINSARQAYLNAKAAKAQLESDRPGLETLLREAMMGMLCDCLEWYDCETGDPVSNN